MDPASQRRCHSRRAALSAHEAAGEPQQPRIMIVLNLFEELRVKVAR